VPIGKRCPEASGKKGGELMPEKYKTGEFKGKPTFSVLTGISREGEEFWFSFGLKKAQSILENIDMLRRWVDIQEGKPGRMPETNSSKDVPF
jgi:hypothetical protein